MKVMGLDIPQAAIDAGNAAMTGDFRLDDVRGAVAGVLRELNADGRDDTFDYGIQSKDAVDDRLADRLVQAARKAGRVHRGRGGWASRS